MIEIHLTDQEIHDLNVAIDDPSHSEKTKIKLLVIRMRHEGAKTESGASPWILVLVFVMPSGCAFKRPARALDALVRRQEEDGIGFPAE